MRFRPPARPVLTLCFLAVAAPAIAEPAGVRRDEPADHWSFRPPRVAGAAHSIDSFIETRLREEGLAMSPEADPPTWLRRVTFDLTGLPPTIEQIRDFQRAGSADPRAARERVVDRLLASPRYGERWAQLWLDVVRYADTHGFEVNTERPHAWPYRDYVIDALNSDTPYDRFIREQIVGDTLGRDAATGFLVTASVLLPGQIGKDPASMRLARQDALDEIIVNIGQTFLGLSIGCARCHDHKFDPISSRDYYALQALVAGVEYHDREWRTPAADAARREAARLRARLAGIERDLGRHVPLARSGATRPPVNPRENTDRFAPAKTRRLRFTIRQTNSLEPCLDELEVFNSDGDNVALATAGTTTSSSGDLIVADRHDLKHLNDGRYGNSRSWMSNEKGRGWVLLEFPEEQTIERVVWGRDRDGRFTDRLPVDYLIEIADPAGGWRAVADSADRAPFDPGNAKPRPFSTKGLSAAEARKALALMNEKQAVEAGINAADNAQKVFAGVFRRPDEIRLLNRGDPEQPGEPVPPAVLGFLGPVREVRDTREQLRRATLADWIASPTNPLTSRVMVNRVWQGHFGIGLVETASDFGRGGLKPSHPELLDWLAVEFIRSGWSVKRLHRLIVLSQTYRQSAASNPAAAAKDADNRLLWRFPSRRLDAEIIRDSILSVSGRLDLKMRGRGFDLFNQRGGLSGFTPVESFTGDGLRRMIYAHKVRREREAVFGAFDCPDAGQSTARRRESTTPIQALNLLNSRFTLEHAAAFAKRIRIEAGNHPPDQIRHAWRLALGREPAPEEIRDAEPAVREHGLATLCRALLNSNEFLFMP